MSLGIRTHLTALAVWVCLAAIAAADDFERQVAPALTRNCAGCHNDSQASGGLNLVRREPALAGGDSGEAAIVPGKPDESYLLARVAAGEMPPPDKAPPVPAADQAVIRAWIQAGAVWPEGRVLDPLAYTSATRAGRDWWSLVRPVRPAVPRVQNAARVRNPIDAFVLEKLELAALEMNPDADRATFLRRASLDLLGLPPTPEEIAAFEGDTAADAFERLVDRLLASPRFGERWGRHWLDVVRFGESNGYETNTSRPNAWPYRDWVIQTINNDLPYPQFVLEQLAGDQVGRDAATGFLVGGPHDTVGSPDLELTSQQRMNDLDDMLSTTATAFLGLTVGCAKCHDHKFDPVPQRDYYALQAMFAGVEHGERELHTPDWQARRDAQAAVQRELAIAEARAREIWSRHQPLATAETSQQNEARPAVGARMNVDRFAPVSARFVRFTVLATNSVEPCLDELEVFTTQEQPTNVALASAGAKVSASSVYADGSSSLHKLEHLNDGRFGNGRSWVSAEPGGGWAQVELAQTATIDRVVWARDREGKFRDRLPTRYKIEASADARSWQSVATSDDRRPFDPKAAEPEVLSSEGLPNDAREELDRQREAIELLRHKLAELAPAKVYAGAFTSPAPTHLLYRGEPLQKRDRIAPGGLAAVAPALALNAEASDAERRVALARWIGSESNPLAARVMVNRIWHYHFGQGLLATPGDFGFGGGKPSHPELLDWLATEFMAGGWHPKAIHRLIMLSSVYRQQSQSRPPAVAADALGRLLWRYNPRRLEAEAIRDSILHTTVSLDTRMGGPGYDVFEPNTSYVKVYTPKRSFGPAEWRRMVYQDKPRMRADATFGEFDCPDSSQVVGRRNVSTTALQALNLLNSPFMLEQAALLAARLEREIPRDPSRQVERSFWLLFGRAPDSDERTAAFRLIEEQGLPAFCRAMFNANEFLYLN